eukprot:TRINITY_DN10669_c0_g1_i1.p1 TRINITY_DN10669_c0_g1~~TRINITY_DN10669_c0_g1_i1.p1  ORF type:complete len:354 (-),score=48.64 TRINITY_DN10669_c0_g1_i1:25-1050(-)
MKHQITLTLIFCLLIALSSAKTIYLSPFGSDVNPGTKSSPLRSLRTALSLVDNGDEIFLLVGLYTSNINYGLKVEKDITITGESKERSVLSCQGASSSSGLVISADVKVKNMNIQYCSSGISVTRGSLSVSDSVLVGHNYAIHTPSTNPPVTEMNIVNNAFEANTYSLYIRSFPTAVIKENTFRQSKGNTYINSVSNLSYEKNYYLNNTQPLYLERCTGMLFDNVFEDNVNPSLDSTSLRIYGGTIQIKQGGFYNNKAKAALYISSSATVSVTSTDFHDNQGTFGAINCQSGSGNIFDSSFRRNTGTTSGAFYCSSSCQLMFNGCTMIDNTPDWSSTTCHV